MGPYLNAINADYIEELAKQYQDNPAAIDPTWRYFFEGMEFNSPKPSPNGDGAQPLGEDLAFEVRVLELIQAYREMGHLIADVNPLRRGIQTHPRLSLSHFGLKESDLDRVCQVGRVLGFGAMPLKTILKNLTQFYCSPVAVEYGHIDDPKCRSWIQKHVESNVLFSPLSAENKIRVLQKLCEAEHFESFLHRRFVGQKRFSVEGLDVIIPMLDFIIEIASDMGADEILLGMAHRGRLNVLSNIFYKDLNIMLGEFSGNFDANVGDGDVKYHMGFSQNITTAAGKEVHLSLLPNPSHLEAVNSVLMGVARAKQKIKNDHARMRTLPVLLHGDASFSGQGSVFELLNMSELPGYTVGGTIHIILNNQIGFTTAPSDARSTPHATDVAKMLEIPIFRVNADEPEAAIRCILLALQFRYKFKRDVVIDLIGYRRYGHNEGDEPTFTQPLMYENIRNHPRVFDVYSKRLVQAKVVGEDQVREMVEAYNNKMEDALTVSRNFRISPMMHGFGERWKKLRRATDQDVYAPVHTGVSVGQLQTIGRQLLKEPENFHIHPKIMKLVEDRREMIEGKKPIDWGMGEALAFASLLCDEHFVRLAGQDAERGTFSHRHSVFHDVETGEKYNPFNHIAEAKADYEVLNSLLSEYCAMGFEFGQSITSPKKLVIWEAQFGDFVNGAQIIIDQFLTSSAFKWQRYSGLVLFLPHGYEGQGPEHSSGRPERFLTACAQNNIQVCNLTTPVQLFHALRRQVLRDFRLPLVILTPKSLLRNPLAVSSLHEFQDGRFQEIIDDADPLLKAKAEKIVLCSGKIYYELLEARKNIPHQNVALIRVEQLYPFLTERFKEVLSSYPKAKTVVWCQEGPQNMEGWNFMMPRLTELLAPGQRLVYAGRAAQASPADGYLHLHTKEQKRIVLSALNGE